MSDRIIKRVYIVHSVKLNLSRAYEYGELVTITRGYIFPDHVPDSHEPPPEIMTQLATAASVFRPDLDYFLLAGDYFQQVLFGNLLSGFHRYFWCLRYDKINDAYLELKLPGGSRLVDTLRK